MSSVKVDVTVYDGRRELETLSDRPVRLTPDDRAGVVYAGEVYPLRSDDSIHLEDRPVAKALCYRFVKVGTPIPYAATPRRGQAPARPSIKRWYLESNRFGHYVVFDGSHGLASDLVDRLRTAGLRVVRWDESVRPADNGEMYDWFARLDYDGTAEQCRQAVAPIVQPGTDSADAPARATAQPTISLATSAARELELTVTRLERDRALDRVAALEPLAKRAEQLERDSRAAAAKTTKLSRRVAEAEQQLEQQAITWSAEIKALRQQLRSARRERDDALRHSTTSERLAEIVDGQAAAEAAWVEAAEEADELRSERDAILKDRAHLREDLELRDLQIEELTDKVRELEDVERERRTRRQPGAPQVGSYEDFLSRLLPRVDMDPDDLDLLREWPDPRDAVRQLLEIDKGGRPHRSRGVERRPGWTEVPGINTGRKGKENLGRLYFRGSAGQRVRVCVHDKQDQKEQDRFIDRLPDV